MPYIYSPDTEPWTEYQDPARRTDLSDPGQAGESISLSDLKAGRNTTRMPRRVAHPLFSEPTDTRMEVRRTSPSPATRAMMNRILEDNPLLDTRAGASISEGSHDRKHSRAGCVRA